MTSHRFLIGVALLFAQSAPALAQDIPIGGPRPVIGYYLPRTKVSAAVAARITQCPTDNGEQQTRSFTVAYSPLIEAKATPDRRVAIDASSGFLADRSTKITFADGLIIKEFNSSTTGQGGPLLSSLIKTAAVGYSVFAAPIASPAALALVKNKAANPMNYSAYIFRSDNSLAIAPPPKMKVIHRYFLACKDDVAAALDELGQRQQELDRAEAQLIAGTAGPALQAVIDARKARIDELKRTLTLQSAPEKPLDPARNPSGAAPALSLDLPPTPFARWFKVADRPALVRADSEEARNAPSSEPPIESLLDQAETGATRLVGRLGYRLTIAVDATLASDLGCGSAEGQERCSTEDGRKGTIKGRDLVYRVPVPGNAKLAPIYCATNAPATCKAPDSWGKEATFALAVKLPQLARLSALRTGGGGMFGSKKVAAEFDATGAPVSLQYDKGSSSKDIASIADALATAGPMVRDARSAALTRLYTEDKTWQDLQDLLDKQLSAAP